jgi:hypothetical protein
LLFAEVGILEEKEGGSNRDGEVGNELKLTSHENHGSFVNLLGDFCDFAFATITADDISEDQAGKNEANDSEEGSYINRHVTD